LPIVIVDSPREALGAISAWIYRTAESAPIMLGITGRPPSEKLATLRSQRASRRPRRPRFMDCSRECERAPCVLSRSK
jgi:hypothetical protein